MCVGGGCFRGERLEESVTSVSIKFSSKDSADALAIASQLIKVSMCVWWGCVRQCLG